MLLPRWSAPGCSEHRIPKQGFGAVSQFFWARWFRCKCRRKIRIRSCAQGENFPPTRSSMVLVLCRETWQPPAIVDHILQSLLSPPPEQSKVPRESVSRADCAVEFSTLCEPEMAQRQMYTRFMRWRQQSWPTPLPAGQLKFLPTTDPAVHLSRDSSVSAVAPWPKLENSSLPMSLVTESSSFLVTLLHREAGCDIA